MAVSRHEFEERRKERLRQQRKQRERTRKIRNVFLILFAILIILIIIVCMTKCKRSNSSGGATAPAVSVATEQPSATPYVEAQASYGGIPSPQKGSNDLLDVIKDSGQRHHVYLTFDGGPDPNVTPKLLDVLRRYNIKGTFFVHGKYVETYPYLCARMVEEGHLVLPLSYSADASILYEDKSTFMEEVDKTYELICNNSLSATKPIKLYRFLGSSASRDAFKDELAKNGYYYCDSNTTIGDENGTLSSEQLVKHFKDTKPDLNNLVIRIGNTSKNDASASALDSIIKLLLDDDYIFNRLDEIQTSGPANTAAASSTAAPSASTSPSASAAPSSAPSATKAPSGSTAASGGSTSSSGVGSNSGSSSSSKKTTPSSGSSTSSGNKSSGSTGTASTGTSTSRGATTSGGTSQNNSSGDLMPE